MRQKALNVLLGVLGIGAVLIALSILMIGAEATGRAGEHAFTALSGIGGAPSHWLPSMDSELRFYAALWLAFGILCIRVARNPVRHSTDTPWLALTFFLGGIGRLLSWISLGMPHPFYVQLMAIELFVPPIVLLLWWPTRSGRAESAH